MREKAVLAVIGAFFLMPPYLNGQTSGEIVVVSDHVFDRAVAEVFAEQIGAELIVLNGGELNESIVEHLILLNPSKVYIVGGSYAVSHYVEILFGVLGGGMSDTVHSGISDEGVEVRRFYGSDRYKTSILVAQEGWERADKVFLVHGFDVLGLEKIKEEAKKEKSPILYYNPYHAPPTVKNLQNVVDGLGAENVTMVTSPAISNVSMVSKGRLMRTDVNATNTLETSPREQAEKALEIAGDGVENAEAGAKILRGIYETNATRKAVEEIYGWSYRLNRDVTLQELRLFEIDENQDLKASRKLLEKAKEAFNNSLYGEAFVLANSVHYHARKAVRMRLWLKDDIKRGYIQEEVGGLSASGAILKLLERAGPKLALPGMPPPPPGYDPEKWRELRKDEEERNMKLKGNFEEAKKALRAGNETLAKELAMEALNSLP
jgi:putative cell wall-binding protein